MPNTVSYPVAKDEHGNWVEIDSARPDGKYYCPECGVQFVARLGNTRRHHFAHKSGVSAVCEGESGYHSLAKQLLAYYFTREKEIPFLSKCPDCVRVLEKNRAVLGVEVEKGGGGYRPDARLVLEGGIVVDCEVVYRNPLGNKLSSYKAEMNDLLIWQINGKVSEVPCLVQYFWDDLTNENLSYILRKEKGKLCLFSPRRSYAHNCTPYGKAHVVEATCWRCHRRTMIALISFWFPKWYDAIEYEGYKTYISSKEIPEGFWEVLNVKYGTNIYPDYSATTHSTYLMNHCSKCKAKFGDFFLHEYVYEGEEVYVEFDLSDWERNALSDYKMGDRT